MSKLNLKQHLLGQVPQPNYKDRRRAVEKNLINAESALGRTLFGYIPAGGSREFFCLKKNVWIWYENGLTIRYEVREYGVFKKVGDGQQPKLISNWLKLVFTTNKLPSGKGGSFLMLMVKYKQ